MTIVDAGAVLGRQRRDHENPNSRSIKIENQSGRKIDLFWVNTFTTPNEFVPQLVEDGVQVGCSYGAEKSISSFIGHQFEAREIPSKHTNECVFAECRKVRFKVSERQEQKVMINPDFSVSVFDDRTKAYSKADDMFSSCQDQVKAETSDPLESIELLTKCMQDQLNQKFDTDRQERTFQTELHRNIAADLVSFACGDVNRTDSFEITNTTWNYEDEDENGKIVKEPHTVRHLHKYHASEIISVDEFASKEACRAMKSLREELPDGTAGILTVATDEDNEDANLVDKFFHKLYDLLDHQFSHWEGEMKFLGDTLFQHVRDSEGVSVPSKKCVGPEEVADAFAAIEAGNAQQCQIPGGDPVRVPTRRIVVDDDNDDEDDYDYDYGRREVAEVFVFCDEPEEQLGGIHFPYAGVHIMPKAGKLVVAVHRQANDLSPKLDDYVDEYHFCPNHDLFTHTVSHPRPKGIP
eukprot:jgi/Psemu1/24785/gm1.24785_g